MGSKIRYHPSYHTAGKYDSWDIENLKYIRRISQPYNLDEYSNSDASNNSNHSNSNHSNRYFSSDNINDLYKNRNNEFKIFKESDSNSKPRARALSHQNTTTAMVHCTPPPIPQPFTRVDRDNPNPSLNRDLDNQNQFQEETYTKSINKMRLNIKDTYHFHSNDSNPNPNYSERQFIQNPQKEIDQFLPEIDSGPNSNLQNQSGNTSLEGPRLDDCYLLDVVTIRNESVLVPTTKKSYVVDPPVPKPRSKIPVFIGNSNGTNQGYDYDSKDSKIVPIIRTRRSVNGKSVGGGNNNKPIVVGVTPSKTKSQMSKGSTGTPSNSSNSSISSLEAQDCQEYLPSPQSPRDKTKGQRDHRNSGNEKPPLPPLGIYTSESVISRSSRSSSSACPFCSDASSTRSTNSYYDEERRESVPRRDSKATRNHELCFERMMSTERTPSPYYVRLRRDLVNLTPPLCTPSNFGIDKQGQLVIDYSQNWNGLESYIKNLKL